jgi:hypothetical protein
MRLYVHLPLLPMCFYWRLGILCRSLSNEIVGIIPLYVWDSCYRGFAYCENSVCMDKSRTFNKHSCDACNSPIIIIWMCLFHADSF